MDEARNIPAMAQEQGFERGNLSRPRAFDELVLVAHGPLTEKAQTDAWKNRSGDGSTHLEK